MPHGGQHPGLHVDRDAADHPFAAHGASDACTRGRIPAMDGCIGASGREMPGPRAGHEGLHRSEVGRERSACITRSGIEPVHEATEGPRQDKGVAIRGFAGGDAVHAVARERQLHGFAAIERPHGHLVVGGDGANHGVRARQVRHEPLGGERSRALGGNAQAHLAVGRVEHGHRTIDSRACDCPAIRRPCNASFRPDAGGEAAQCCAVRCAMHRDSVVRLRNDELGAVGRERQVAQQAVAGQHIPRCSEGRVQHPHVPGSVVRHRQRAARGTHRAGEHAERRCAHLGGGPPVEVRPFPSAPGLLRAIERRPGIGDVARAQRSLRESDRSPVVAARPIREGLCQRIAAILGDSPEVRCPGEERRQGHERRGDRRQRNPVAAHEALAPLATRERPRMGGLPVEDALQVAGEFPGRLVAARRFLLQELRHHGLHVARKRAVESAKRRRHLVPDDGGGRHDVPPVHRIGHAPRQRLVQHDPDRVEIAPGVGLLCAAELLRGHVRNGPDELARHRAHGRLGSLRALRRVRVHDARHTEIDDLREAGRRDQHVARLQVAVHDPACVRVPDRVRDLQEELQHVFQPHSAGADPRRERDAFDELHHEERSRRKVRGIGAGTVDPRDPRVLKAAQEPHLSTEPAQRAGVPCAAVEHLHGHDAIGLRLARAQDHAA